MFPLTILMLILGALLAASGTAGFAIVYQQGPSPEDLRLARATATTGRRLLVPGLVLFLTHHGAAGPGLAALLIATALAVASYLTKSTAVPNPRSNSSGRYT